MRQRNLALVVNNARFLILPWIRIDNLASHLLAQLQRRLPHDWERRYVYGPFRPRDRIRAAGRRAGSVGWGRTRCTWLLMLFIYNGLIKYIITLFTLLHGYTLPENLLRESNQFNALY